MHITTLQNIFDDLLTHPVDIPKVLRLFSNVGHTNSPLAPAVCFETSQRRVPGETWQIPTDPSNRATPARNRPPPNLGRFRRIAR